MSAAVTDATGYSDSAAATLSALHHFLDAPSIELLRQVVGLTHSGAVRLIDKLQRDGLVRRKPGPDGRSTSVVLLPRGRRVAAKITEARTEILEQTLGAVSKAEQESLDVLTGKMLAALKRGPGSTSWICRFCDVRACGLEEGHCPHSAAPFSVAENVAALESTIAKRRL